MQGRHEAVGQVREGLGDLAVRGASRKALVGAEPDFAVRPGEDRAHFVGGQPVRLAHALEHASVAPAHCAVRERAHPQAAIGGRGQAQHGAPGEHGAGADGLDAVALDPAHAAAGAHPEHALGILEHGAHVVAGQPARLGEGAERSQPQPHQPAVGAHPETAFPVLEHGADAIVRQAVGLIEQLEAAGGEPEQAPVMRADPERPVMPGTQLGHADVREGGIERHQRGLGRAAHPQAPVGSHQQPASARVECQRGDRQPRQAGPGYGMYAAVLVVGQAVVRAYPDPAVRCLGERVDRVAGQAVGPSEVAPAAIGLDDHRAMAVGGQPQAATLVLEDVGHQARCRGQGEPAPGALPGQSAARAADEQVAVAQYPQCAQAGVGQAGVGQASVDLKAAAIEAGRAFPGGKPQVALGRLGDGIDRVVRQSFARAPGLEDEALEWRRGGGLGGGLPRGQKAGEREAAGQAQEGQERRSRSPFFRHAWVLSVGGRPG